jgi:hypothetical protein
LFLHVKLQLWEHSFQHVPEIHKHSFTSTHALQKVSSFRASGSSRYVGPIP